jgi:hypothetical protein
MNHAIRGNQRPSEAIRGAHHEPCNQRPSEAIRGHQRSPSLTMQSEAIRGHQRPSEEPIMNHQEHINCNHQLQS